MKSRRLVRSSAAIVAIIAFICLLTLPSPSIARTIKGHIVDVVAENIGNITVTARTDAGDTKTSKACDGKLTATPDFNEPLNIDVDNQRMAPTTTAESQTNHN